MHKLTVLILALLLLTPSLASAKTYYVTDKVLVGVYQEADTDSKLLKVIPTGTPLEILERSEKYARVRTSDGLIGWVDSTYTIDHKPAQHVVLELADKQKQTQQKLDAANKQVVELKKEIKQLTSQNNATGNKNSSSQLASLQKDIKKRDAELNTAREELAVLEKRVIALQDQLKGKAVEDSEVKVQQTKIEALRKQLAAKDQAIADLNTRMSSVMQAITGDAAASSVPSANGAPTSSGKSLLPEDSYVWVLIAAISALVLGFLIAYLVAQRRSTRSHGSFRIHLNT